MTGIFHIESHAPREQGRMFMFSGFDHGQLSYEAMILSSVAYSGSEDAYL